jgi:hypothetical protein
MSEMEFRKLFFLFWENIMTCGPIAMERVGEHISV